MSQRKLKGGKVWPMHNESAMSEGSVATAPKKLDLRVIGSKARTLSSQDEERVRRNFESGNNDRGL